MLWSLFVGELKSTLISLEVYIFIFWINSHCYCFVLSEGPILDLWVELRINFIIGVPIICYEIASMLWISTKHIIQITHFLCVADSYPYYGWYFPYLKSNTFFEGFTILLTNWWLQQRYPIGITIFHLSHILLNDNILVFLFRWKLILNSLTFINTEQIQQLINGIRWFNTFL